MKIVITGPESSGKTTLLNEINNKWNFTIIPEYARIYIDKLNRPYNYDDILEIAKGQIALEDNLNEVRSTLLFADTDLLTLQIWCEYRYNKCHTFINKEFLKRLPDLYLLCFPDIPWEFDPQRENPHDRLNLFNIYKRKIEELKVDYAIIKGTMSERLKMIEQIIESTNLIKL